MIVMKFGGTSVATPENILKVKDIVQSKKGATAVIVSAFSGCTNALEELAELSLKGEFKEALIKLKDRHVVAIQTLISIENQSVSLSFVNQQCNWLEDLCNGVYMLQELSDRSRAKFLGLGEILSSFIITETFKEYFPKVTRLDSRKLIVTDDNYLKAKVNFSLTNRRIRENIDMEDKDICYVLPGFISSTVNDISSTLGRGGSDYTAAIIANAVRADKLEIWSDVNGMLNASPKLVKHAKSIEALSYQEAFELSHFGAKVLYPPSILPVLKRNIPLILKNTFDPSAEGTLISEKSTVNKGDAIKGISSLNDIALLIIAGVGMVGVRGISRRIFESLEQAGINVILITQSSSEHSVCIGVAEDDQMIAIQTINNEFENEIGAGVVNPVEIDNELSIIAIVGDEMKERVGVSGRAFSALGKNGINIRAIAQGSSERNISIVVDTKDVKKAINVLHERFFGDSTKTVHLFIAGIGNVGHEFMQIVKEQQSLLKEELNISLKVVGIVNSKQMLVTEEGISLDNYKEALKTDGQAATINDFVDAMAAMNLRNAVFIDNTASEVVSAVYQNVLNSSISVVACNKIAISTDYSAYEELKALAKLKNSHFRYETCVGAALPVISTIQDLLTSGDHVKQIDAVLSGSLNFIFNNYDGTASFASVVRQAKEEGYTEPNPLIDLSGKDVMRKIIILGREVGSRLEMDKIQNNAILPAECLAAPSVDELFASLERNEAHFKSIYDAAKAKGCKLKYVASFSKNGSSVGVQEIPSDHPFFNLDGKDNIVSINSDRYPEQPLVIKGAGAGAQVTASGVFSDIMRIFNN
ncbi:MAG: bifunctional aspartate kinase/homoserine dehydrogenase I [Aureispira sp.]|nr:bifunctional aspartate kinase/homoserine dehydrogenase I [Aureispira sp.]